MLYSRSVWNLWVWLVANMMKALNIFEILLLTDY